MRESSGPLSCFSVKKGLEINEATNR